MKKRVYFDVFDGPGWPAPTELRRYFLAPPGRRWTFDSGNDSWGLSMRGLDGTEDLSTGRGRIDLDLTMLGNPDHGVLLHYDRTGGARRVSYYSRGDLRRLREWVLTLHGDLMPIGLYIPFETAALRYHARVMSRVPDSCSLCVGPRARVILTTWISAPRLRLKERRFCRRQRWRAS